MAEAEKNGALDYLISEGPASAMSSKGTEPKTTAPPSVLEAFASVQVLQTVHDLEQGSGGSGQGVFLSVIDERLRLGALALVPSVRLLVDAGLIAIKEKRPFDDDEVTVTTKGVEMLAAERQADLLELLGGS